MYKLVLVGTVLGLISAQVHPVNKEIIAEIRAKASTWEPMDLEENPLYYKSIDEVRGLLGTILDAEDITFPDPEPTNTVTSSSFDARTKWGSCIHPIRDQ